MNNLPILLGDFNCLTSPLDTENNFANKKCDALNDLVNTLNYSDGFRLFQPQAASYTFFRRGAAASRLDRVYLPAHLVQDITQCEHFPYISDHKGVKCILRHSNFVNPPLPKL